MYVKLFVGNLPWGVRDEELGEMFSGHGTVQSARVITDRDTGRSRGFGFVEMETDNVDELIRATNGLEIEGRNLRVNEAEDKDRGARRPSGDRGGDRDGGFGGNRDRGPRRY